MTLILLIATSPLLEHYAKRAITYSTMMSSNFTLQQMRKEIEGAVLI